MKIKHIKIILGVLGLFILSCYLILDLWTITNERTGSLYDDNSKIDLFVDINEINPNDNTGTVDLKLRTRDESDTSNIPNEFNLYISSSGVMVLGDGTAIVVNESSFHSIDVKFDEPEIFIRDTLIDKYFEAKETIEIALSGKETINIFPFDSYTIRLYFSLTDKTGKKYFPNIFTRFSDNRLVASDPIREFSYGRKRVPIRSSLMIYCARPQYQIIFFIAVIIMAFSVTIWTNLRVASKKEVNISPFEILGLNISLILTFPDLKGLIVPDNVGLAPLFDISALIIWLLSIIAIFTYLLKSSAKANKINNRFLKTVAKRRMFKQRNVKHSRTEPTAPSPPPP